MKFRKFLTYGVLVGATAFFLGACGNSSQNSNSTSTSNSNATTQTANNGGKVVFIPKVTGNSFFESGNLGAQEMAKKEGFTVDYNGNPVASVANQVTIINNAVQTGAGSIAVSSVDPTGLDNALKQAQKAGLKVVTWDSDVSPDARSLMVSQGTPTQLGEMLVKMSVDALEKRELLKVSILQNCEEDKDEVAKILSERTSSELVQVIGHTIVLYKQSSKEKYRKIELVK